MITLAGGIFIETEWNYRFRNLKPEASDQSIFNATERLFREATLHV
ncbi:hypothetical protein ACPOL_6294 [Acidisarcina polymorpha]|uniref:Uncharacterized protein n=1 Tax=Acidisarcina polymorpha TaxID=2211140 RepID=A0A2Z5G973_9BACT|nr:hypothetical protein ACPOL_6294 [Acidisarcina polymorpha]